MGRFEFGVTIDECFLCWFSARAGRMGQPITGSREPADEAASEHLGNPWLPNKQPEGTLPDVREALNEAPDPTPLYAHRESSYRN